MTASDSILTVRSNESSLSGWPWPMAYTVIPPRTGEAKVLSWSVRKPACDWSQAVFRNHGCFCNGHSDPFHARQPTPPVSLVFVWFFFFSFSFFIFSFYPPLPRQHLRGKDLSTRGSFYHSSFFFGLTVSGQAATREVRGGRPGAVEMGPVMQRGWQKVVKVPTLDGQHPSNRSRRRNASRVESRDPGVGLVCAYWRLKA
ncbi:hypothetical protein LZ32DRAFT_459551 [Colletotrichum eremochloae]|nr:hypothetical protein LZ32DRAFT_459551 [Colletotrichum eremochloae]